MAAQCLRVVSILSPKIYQQRLYVCGLSPIICAYLNSLYFRKMHSKESISGKTYKIFTYFFQSNRMIFLYGFIPCQLEIVYLSLSCQTHSIVSSLFQIQVWIQTLFHQLLKQLWSTFGEPAIERGPLYVYFV